MCPGELCAINIRNNVIIYNTNENDNENNIEEDIKKNDNNMNIQILIQSNKLWKIPTNLDECLDSIKIKSYLSNTGYIIYRHIYMYILLKYFFFFIISYRSINKLFRFFRNKIFKIFFITDKKMEIYI